jgi:hypothetical protein
MSGELREALSSSPLERQYKEKNDIKCKDFDLLAFKKIVAK